MTSMNKFDAVTKLVATTDRRTLLRNMLGISLGLTGLGGIRSAAAQDDDEKKTKTIVLADGRSPDARTTVENPDLGVPPYGDTGVGKKKSWKLSVPEGWTLIVGGVTVKVDDEKAHDKGFMIAVVGPEDEKTYRVVDGFYKYVESDFGDWDEFCMRVQQHQQNGWLLSEIEVPESWDMCPSIPNNTETTTSDDSGANTSSSTSEDASSTPEGLTFNADGTITLADNLDPNTTTVNGRTRKDAIANGGSDVIDFAKGDWAFGESVGTDGAMLCSGFCRVDNTSKPGTVYGGLVNPTIAEWNSIVAEGYKDTDL